MFCSISGSPPEEPVVSTKTGHLYERRLIEKALAETGECPVTKQPLTREDLLAVKTNQVIKPRTNAATSIPGLLSIFHNEWDALMLETATLRESLDGRNKELATSLYQYDAACRVIARLVKERDEARAGMAAAPVGSGGKRSAGNAMEVDGEAGGKKAKGGLTQQVLDQMAETAQTLSKSRRKRVASAQLASQEALGGYALRETLPLHKSSSPGISAVALHPGRPGEVFATAGADKTGVVYDRAAGKKTAELKGHTKELTDIKFAGAAGSLLTSSLDKTVRLWAPDASGDGAYRCAATFSEHAAGIAALAVHPSSAFAVSAAQDGSWAFLDIASAQCMAHVSDPAVAGAAFACCAFHPDGLILGTGGADACVRIWDVKTASSAATFEGHQGRVAALSFSENGYFLATAAADGVKVWDLRKLKCLHSIPGGPCLSVEFDHSGQYLAVGGQGASVHASKADFAVVKAFEALGPKKTIQAVRFGPDASFLAVGAAADHNLRLYAA